MQVEWETVAAGFSALASAIVYLYLKLESRYDSLVNRLEQGHQECEERYSELLHQFDTLQQRLMEVHASSKPQ